MAINATVVVASGVAGFLTLRPTGTNDVTSFINWPTGGTLGLANAGIIALDPAIDGSGMAFDALASGNRPNLIVDVFGYFASARSPAEPLDCQVNLGSQYQLAANEIVMRASPSCAIGYVATIAECLNESTSDVYLIGSGFQEGSTSNAFCQWKNSTAHTNDFVLSGVKCCRTAAH